MNIKQLIKKYTIKFYKKLTHIIPTSKKIIIFQSSNGRNYTGNPRYIYEEMIRQGLDKKYKCIWFLFDTSIEVPGNCKKIRNNYFPYFWYLMRAGFWVFDSRQPKYCRKKKNVTYIQTWHGTPLKKLALDMDRMDMGGSTNIEGYHRKFLATCNDWDYLVSQNSFSTEIFKSCFAFKDRPILQIGYPRNDILIRDNNKEKIKEYKKKLGLPLDKKIILYAPTWRDDQFYEAGQYGFELDLDVNRLQEEFGDEYVLLLRLHYFIVDQLDLSKYGDFTVDGSSYDDITDLYLISDMLITDYSSVFFDYANLKRPVLYYTYDLDKYRDVLRGFYLDMEKDLPGPLLLTNDEVVDAIKNIDKIKEQYKDRYEEFYNRFCCVDDGHAAQRVVEKVFK